MKEQSISEDDFLTQVIDLAHIYGWKVAHFRPAQTKHGWRTAVSAEGKGFPDCVMVRDGQLIFAELKSEKGKVSEAQQEWLDLLNEVSDASRDYVYDEVRIVHIYLWRPSDFDSIVEILK